MVLSWVRVSAVVVGLAAAVVFGGPVIAEPIAGAQLAASEEPDLSTLSIEQLANLNVSSVSKRAQPVADAPSSIYVIDHNQIVRSGALTIPEILRLAPNLQVYEASPSRWVVTARGLNGNPNAQSYANKLLVLIDGRTIYTPLFSGVYWDLPDLLPDDIDRIEVISGPGATLWGANAMNGVINIITRNADSTSGAYVKVDAGKREQVAGVRLAGQAGNQVSYRVYARGIHEDAFHLPHDGSADDAWHRIGAGFRVDWTPASKDNVTLEGDIFTGDENQLGSTHEAIAGHDLVLRWIRDEGKGQQLQVQAFYDRFSRADRPNNGHFFANTYDLDVQHSMPIGGRHQLVWGGGGRVVHYDINGTPSLYFDPESRNLFLGNAFVQDTFAVSPNLSVTAGVKAEHDPYVGFSILPDLRFAFKPTTSTLLWAAVSRAVRSPTPFDEDVQERVGTIVALSGNRDFKTEKLTSYEIGVRAQPSPIVSFSLTGFYHRYNDLKTVEVTNGPATVLNLYWGNELGGRTYGLDAWANLTPLPWWTLSAGATLLHENFDFSDKASAPFVGTWQNGVDPSHYLTLKSSMDLGSTVTLDMDLRAVGKLPHTNVPAYAELGGKLAWSLSQHFAISVSGSNLLHARHVEYPGGDAIPRQVLAGLEWRP